MGNFNTIYKILKILENSMGDEKFSVEAISAQQMKISYERWEQLMIMLADEGYISGIVVEWPAKNGASFNENAKVLKEMIDRNVVQEAFTVKRGTDFNAMNHLFGNDSWTKKGIMLMVK